MPIADMPGWREREIKEKHNQWQMQMAYLDHLLEAIY